MAERDDTAKRDGIAQGPGGGDVAPRVGVDEWVARHEERRAAEAWWRRAAHRVPGPVVLLAPVALAALLPAVTSDDYVLRVAVNTVLFALLAVGLNVTVGWAGLLDLGYVAFYGFGAYAYALLSSDQFDLHWPTPVTVAVVVVASGLLGLLLGLPSRRLVGDYLAIVTLFFAQIFVVVTTNADAITLPWNDGATDVTGGPNGIAGVDPMTWFGVEFGSMESYLWFSLGVFTVVTGALALAQGSRTGRAWRALRDDPLAAELLSMPVNHLKLLAFVCGAVVAGLTGTIFASVQLGVFPSNFDLPLLITIYAMVILGGAGSLPGVVIGAIVINVLLELLRDPEQARWVFYLVAVGLVLLAVRPLWRAAVVLAATVALGVVAYAVVDAVRPAWTSGSIEGGRLAGLLDGWVVHPADSTRLGNVGFVLLVGSLLGVTLLSQRRRVLVLPPLLYLAAFVWEARLAPEPAITRVLLLGALLVVLMTVRPQGLLGTQRVEIV